MVFSLAIHALVTLLAVDAAGAAGRHARGDEGIGKASPVYSARLVEAKQAPQELSPGLDAEPPVTPAADPAAVIGSGAKPNIAAPGADYHPGSALGTPPRPLGDIEPRYPTNDNLQEGTVVIQILINERGSVDDVIVVRSFPKGIFEAAAVEAFRQAAYSPGKLFGVAVKSQMMIEVKFSPYNRGELVNGRLN